MDMAGVFLSCVSKEFHGDSLPRGVPWPGSYREQLAHFLQQCGQPVVYQETFAQGGGDLLAKLEDYIAGECKAVIQLIGHDPGWSPDDDLPSGSLATSDAVCALLARHGDSFLAGRPSLRQRLVERRFRGMSATQWEAYLAIHYKTPLLVFAFADSAERSPTFQPPMTPRADRLSQAEHFELLKLTSFDRTEQIRDQHEFKEAAIAALVRASVLSQAEATPRPRCSEFSSIGSLFVGRQRAMDDLRASLRQAGTRATGIVASQVIHGQGGIGKTRLAIEFGLAHAEEYSALLFVGADTPQSLENNLANLVGPLVLSLPEDAKVDEKLAAVLRWLHTHPGYFLILDNVDSEAAAQAVEEKLAILSSGHIVITSRIAHWSASVEPLHLDVLSEEDSTNFLLRATERKAGIGRVASPTDDADARLLACDVAGLALALEQSAAFIRTKQTTFAKYRQRWAEFDMRVRDFKDQRLLKYPHSVLTTWAATFEQLTEAAVKLLRACSVLAHEPIPLFLLESVDADYEEYLAELSKYSLAERSEDGSSAQVHKVVQEIVRFRMEESDLRDTLLLLLKSLVTIYRDRYDYTPQRECQRTVAMVHAETCVGHAKLSDSKQTDKSKTFTTPLFQFILAKFQTDVGHYVAALAHTSQALDWALSESSPNERLIASIRLSRADIRHKLGDHSGALDDIESAMQFELQQTSRDERRLADCRSVRASIRRTDGNLTDALEDIAAAITVYTQHSESECVLIAMLNTQACLRLSAGDIHGAHQAVNAAIERLRKQSAFNGIQLAHSLSVLATVLAHLQEFAEAVIAKSEAIELLKACSYVDEVKIAQWRVDRALLQSNLGDVSKAQDEIESILEWAAGQSQQAPDFQHRIAGWLGARGEVRARTGDLTGAHQDVTAAIESHRSQLPVDGSALSIFVSLRASIRRSLGDLLGALEDITADVNFRTQQSPVNYGRLGAALTLRSEIRRGLGDSLGAQDDITSAIDWTLRQSPVDEKILAVNRYLRSMIRRDLGDLGGAFADITDTIEWTLRQSPLDEGDLAIGLEQRAYIRHDQGDLHGALEDITAAIEVKLWQTPIDECFVAALRFERAAYRREQGNLLDAHQDITAAIDCELCQSNVDECVVASRRVTRATVRRDQGDLTGAHEDTTAVIEWAMQQSPIDEPRLAGARSMRASIRQGQGDLLGAQEDIASAIDWFLRQSPVNERNLAISQWVRASIRQDQGDLAGAFEDIIAAVDMGLRQVPVDERTVAIFRVTLASILRERQDLDAALSTINLALDWFLAQNPLNEQWIAKGRAARSRILQGLNRITEANADISAAFSWYETHLPGDTRTIAIFRQIRDGLPPI